MARLAAGAGVYPRRESAADGTRAAGRRSAGGPRRLVHFRPALCRGRLHRSHAAGYRDGGCMSACHDSVRRDHAQSAVVHVHRGGPLVALVGNPNCGKTALFNVLTGSRQKVANYAGVTVERKEGRYLTTAGKALRVLDLPGTYSLIPRSPDEQVTVDKQKRRARSEKRPDRVVCVIDATNLRRNLR